MTPLLEKQVLFLPLVAKLIEYAYSHGYQLTAGELYRTPEQAALNAQHHTGIANSLHTLRLAIDLQLFRDGNYLTQTEDYAPLGQYWESLAPDCTWGGRFQKPDADHFSITWGGIK